MLKSIQDCAAQYGLSVCYVAPEIIQALYDRTRALRYGVRIVNYEVESTLGPAFASYENEAGMILDVMGTLESPELRIHGGISGHPSSAEPVTAATDNDNLDPDALGWDHDA